MEIEIGMFVVVQIIEILSRISEKLNLAQNMAYDYNIKNMIKKDDDLNCRICLGIL